MLSYHLLKPTRLSKRLSLLLGIATGVAAAFAAHFLLMWGFERESHYSGWPTSIAIGIMVAAAVYRMGRERLLPLESNLVARGIAAVYRPTLTRVLAHKASFLTIPVALTLLGVTIWQGFERIASPIASASRSVGLDVTATGAWQRLAATFPGIGREFMPPLDEGSLLYMPSLLPSASLSEVQEVIARQDEAIAQVPEVASVVGK
ncbi:MAG: hypothetical protein L6Q35_17010, partial [Phycisphaerales bacterium]|nr:hypothetical protein [Phycisphaerales bacterium]